MSRSVPSPARPTAAEANEAIRAFARARRGRSWTAEERAEYARLLRVWTEAAHHAAPAAV